MRVVKAHISSKISIVQDSHNSIQRAPDSNWEPNDLGDQEGDSQREQEAEETIPEYNGFRYERKRTRILRENYVPWHNVQVGM